MECAIPMPMKSDKKGCKHRKIAGLNQEFNE